MADPGRRQNCLICVTSRLREVLDAGPQPLSNRYRRLKNSREYRHSLVLGVCPRCGLLQLQTPVPVSELRPRMSGILYREAEGHLDSLVDQIVSLPGIGKDSVFWGLSFKDDSTLARLRGRGYTHTFRIDPLKDLGIRDGRSGLETLQSRITPARISTLIRRRGLADVILARHILEHAYQPGSFLNAVTSALQRGGRLVFEVPSCARALKAGDYTMIWEDHILYFVPETLKRVLSIAGLSLDATRIFPYPLEDAIIAMASKPAKPSSVPRRSALPEMGLAKRYGNSFSSKRRELQKTIRHLKERVGPLALLGAGHLSCHFMNLLGAGPLIDYVLDDHPLKQGRFMPGSHIRIQSSAILQQGAIKCCLLAVSPESQPVVLQRNRSFLAAGGKFASIFPGARKARVPFLRVGLS